METNRRANAVLLGRSDQKMIWRFFRVVIVLALLGLLALIGYSYSGFMVPETRDVTEPVELDES